MAAVVQLDAVIPVLTFSGDDYGAWSIQQALNAKGYSSNVQPLQAQKKLQVRLRKIAGRGPQGEPIFGAFDDSEGKAQINAAASSFFTKLAAFKDWSVSVVAKGADAVQTAVTPKTYTDAYKPGGGFWQAIPWWVPWLAGGLAGLYVLNSVVNAKKAFLGGAPSGRGMLGGKAMTEYRGWSIEKTEGVQVGYRTPGSQHQLFRSGKGRKTSGYILTHPEHYPGGKWVSTQAEAREYIDNYMGPEGT